MMSERDNDRERAVRFVDFGMEEAETTFDIGGPVSQEEIDAMRERLEEMKKSAK